MGRAESEKCPFTSDFKLGVSSDFKHPEVQEPHHCPEAGPLPPTPRNLPRQSSPTAAVRLGSQCTLGAGSQRINMAPLPGETGGRCGQSLLGLCIQRNLGLRELGIIRPISPAWEANTHRRHGSPWSLEPGPWDRVWGGASPWA